MFELVFGPESTFVPPKNPVDRKLDRLIRSTWHQAVSSKNGDKAALPLETQDDLSVSTTSNSFGMFPPASMGTPNNSFPNGLLQRSNSMPDIYSSQMDTVMEMETGD
jgi:hypothetical protein